MVLWIDVALRAEMGYTHFPLTGHQRNGRTLQLTLYFVQFTLYSRALLLLQPATRICLRCRLESRQQPSTFYCRLSSSDKKIGLSP